jgi:hypothetical protein
MADLRRLDIKDAIATLLAEKRDITQAEAEHQIIDRVEAGQWLMWGDFNPGAGLEETQIKPWWCQYIAWWHDEAADPPRPESRKKPEPIQADRLAHKGAHFTLFKPGLEGWIRFDDRAVCERENRRISDYQRRGVPVTKRTRPPTGWVRNLTVVDAAEWRQSMLPEAMPLEPISDLECGIPADKPKRKRAEYDHDLESFLTGKSAERLAQMTDNEVARRFIAASEKAKRADKPCPPLPALGNRLGNVANGVKRIRTLLAERASRAAAVNTDKAG